MPAPDLPDPLMPGDADIRRLHFMQLDVLRLMESDFFAIASGWEFKAAVALWSKAWLQVPAGSLPDDDRVLAHMAGIGGRWKKARQVALHGWIKCNDGRLYHPVVCEKAMQAWESCRDHAEGKAAEADRLRRHRDLRRQMFAQLRERGIAAPWNASTAALRELLGIAGPADLAETEAERPATPPVTQLIRLREGEGEGENPSAYAEAPPAAAAAPPAEAVASSAAPRQCQLPLDVRDDLANTGVGLVMRITGKGEGRSRALLGRWRREARDDHGLVLSVLRRAEAEKPAEPVAWIEGAIKARAGNVARGVPNEQADAPAPAPRPAPAPVDPSHPLAGIAASMDPSIWRSWISRLGLASVTPGEEAVVLAPSMFFRDAIRRDHLPLLSRALGVPKVRVLVGAPAGTG